MNDKNCAAFTLMLHPIETCNLDCSYCYLCGVSTGVMNDNVLCSAFRKALGFAERSGFSEVHILWHGGEPLLAGLPFFQNAINILRELPTTITIRHFLQTNGILLDDDFCIFFRDAGFSVGLSLDGPAEIHDSMRKNPLGQGSYKIVVDRMRLLKKYSLSVGFNAVITQCSLDKEALLYRFFHNSGCGFRVNPVLPAGKPGTPSTYLLKQGEYGAFLCRLFEEWASTESGRVRISPLDIYLRAVIDGVPRECQQWASCVGYQIAVKPSGEVLLCSRFNSGILGNILDTEIESLLVSPLTEAIRKRPEKLEACHACSYWGICHGGCPHNALVFQGDIMEKDFYCKDYQAVYEFLKQTVADCQVKFSDGR